MDILVEKLTKAYEGRRVLDIHKLAFNKGHIYAVLGLNGSGKSTLLECIAGLQRQDEGQVLYDGKLFREDLRKNISMLAQKPYLFHKNVLENITAGLRFRKHPAELIQQRLEKYLPYFEVQSLLHKNAKRLSGGEAAKTALLRTAVLESKLILLDEPTASMDMESTLMAEKLIRGMVSRERTIILITHDLYQAQRIADEVIFLDKGKVIEQGKINGVFTNPHNELVKRMLNM